MVICGVDMDASRAIIVLLDGSADDHKMIDPGFRFLAVTDTNDSSAFKTFRSTFDAMVHRHAVTHIAIQGRARGGRYGGGPIGFKLEGIIQLNETAEVSILSGATVRAAWRDTAHPAPTSLTGYQEDAYKTAYAFLRRR